MLAASENALIAALQGHALAVAKRLRVDSLPKLGTKDLLARYATDAPALYVLPGTLRMAEDNAVLMHTVAGVVRNVRGHASARKGDGIDVGLDHLLVIATQRIHARRLGDVAWRLVSAAVVDDELFDSTGLAAIEMSFEGGPVELPAEVAFADLADFETFHADVDVAPHAGAQEYASWLQTPPNYATSAPEAQLHQTLQGATDD